HIEKQRVSPVAAPPCGEDGEAVASATEAIEHHLARMSRELARRREAREEAHRFGNLRDAGVDAGERIGLVVDDDRQPKLVQRRDVFQIHGEGAGYHDHSSGPGARLRSARWSPKKRRSLSGAPAATRAMRTASAMTPAEARTQIAELYRNPALTDRLARVARQVRRVHAYARDRFRRNPLAGG